MIYPFLCPSFWGTELPGWGLLADSMQWRHRLNRDRILICLLFLGTWKAYSWPFCYQFVKLHFWILRRSWIWTYTGETFDWRAALKLACSKVSQTALLLYHSFVHLITLWRLQRCRKRHQLWKCVTSPPLVWLAFATHSSWSGIISH